MCIRDRAKAERAATRTEAEERVHQVHINAEQKALRTAAFETRQAAAHEEAELRKARAHASALKEAAARASAEYEAAHHRVPVAPTLCDHLSVA